MSELKVNSIKGVSASSAAISINNTDGTCTANLTNRTNKNLVINGDFRIAQRATSSTTSGIATVDRFGMYHTGVDEAPTQAQGSVTSGGAYDSGFRNCLKVTNGNQTSGGGSAKYIWIQSLFEAQDIANSGWNYTSTSSFITVQFWVKSSVAQNFYGYVRTVDGSNYLYPFETGSLSANTWTKVTKTIPGNSNLTFDNDTGHGFQINIFPYLGTGYTGSISLNTWSAYNSSVRVPDYTATWYTTDDATFELTGVQIEVSDHATSFQFRSYAEELALCQRYYFQNTATLYLCAYGSNAINNMFFPVEMRATPTVSETTTSGNLTSISQITRLSCYYYTASSTGSAGTGIKANAEV
mgnify:CR=1 FL=1|jgi:hypothetical protein|tara:strand:- start:62 stop:1123 length:1062 start_codon:yes stop_codon:yes gene_type:complete